MDAYETLRRQAEVKRDEIVSAARAEYRQIMTRLNELRRTINGADLRSAIRKTRQSLLEMARELLPTDRAFTVNDVVELIAKVEPGRTIYGVTIRTYFTKLAQEGVIRRVAWRKGQKLWATFDSSVPLSNGDERPATALAAEIIRTSGPQRVAELVAEMRRRG